MPLPDRRLATRKGRGWAMPPWYWETIEARDKTAADRRNRRRVLNRLADTISFDFRRDRVPSVGPGADPSRRSEHNPFPPGSLFQRLQAQRSVSHLGHDLDSLLLGFGLPVVDRRPRPLVDTDGNAPSPARNGVMGMRPTQVFFDEVHGWPHRCPSAIAQGREDRCGLFAFPPRCEPGGHCSMRDPESHRHVHVSFKPPLATEIEPATPASASLVNGALVAGAAAGLTALAWWWSRR